MLAHRRSSLPLDGPELDDWIAERVREGRLTPSIYKLADVLAEIGPLTGPITDAGTRALQEQRREWDLDR
jgi:hypothetical protein